MCEEVFNVIRRWQSDERLTALSEARICSAVIVPILRGLNWDIANPEEVWEQYPVEEIGMVDYALLIGNEPKVLVEVKRGGESLDRHQSQIRNYARIGGVSLATLTNGATWRFYLPLQEGSWERTRVGDVEIQDQDTVEIAQRLVDLLSRENVSSENAIKNAENLQKRNQIAEALPEAWEQLVNDKIPNLLEARVQELCGHKPSRNEVGQFLSGHLEQIQITPHPTARAPVAPPEPDPSSKSKPSGSMKGKKLKSFTFDGNRHEVTTWISMLVRLCELVHSAQESRFDEVLNLRATPRSKPWFSKNSKDFQKCKPIDKTGIVVDSNKTADEIVVIAENLMTHFGYNKGDWSFDIE